MIGAASESYENIQVMVSSWEKSNQNISEFWKT